MRRKLLLFNLAGLVATILAFVLIPLFKGKTYYDIEWSSMLRFISLLFFPLALMSGNYYFFRKELLRLRKKVPVLVALLLTTTLSAQDKKMAIDCDGYTYYAHAWYECEHGADVYHYKDSVVYHNDTTVEYDHVEYRHYDELHWVVTQREAQICSTFDNDDECFYWHLKEGVLELQLKTLMPFRTVGELLDIMTCE